MIGLTHAVQPLIRPDEHRLGALELRTRFKFPIEIRAVDACLQSRHTVVVNLCKHLEIAAVDEAHGEHLALRFRRSAPQECRKRIVLPRGVSAAAADCRDARCKRTDLDVTLTRPRPRQLHPVVFRIGQVKRHTHDLLQVQHFLAVVAIAHTARNRAALGKNCIEEFRTQPRDRILHLNDEGLCLIVRLHVGRRQTCELRLAVHDAMRCVLHIKDAAAVLLQYVQRGTAKIRRTVGRKLLPNRIQRVVAAVRKDARRHPAMDALK